MDQWTMFLPFRRVPLGGNDRGHTADRRHTRDQANVKLIARRLARANKLPALRAALLELVYYPGNNRRQDDINLAPTMKYIVDGIVEAGVLPDDSASYVLRSSLRIVLKRDDPWGASTPRMILVVQDASALAPLPHFAPQEAV